jgi:hypothetical protein
VPQQTGQVHPQAPDKIGRSLVYSIAPSIDKIRQIATDLGLRPYRVFMIHVAWTGARRGDGQPMETARREIKPTPKITNMDATTFMMRGYGMTEEGGVAVTRISLDFTEDDLTGKTPDLIDPEIPRTGRQNADFFWEIVEARPTSPQTIPRKYRPTGVPHRGSTGWRVGLIKVTGDRSRGQTFNRTSA